MPSDEDMLLQQENARREAAEQRRRQAALPVQQKPTISTTVHAAVLREPGMLNSRRFAHKQVLKCADAHGAHLAEKSGAQTAIVVQQTWWSADCTLALDALFASVAYVQSHVRQSRAACKASMAL